MRNTNKKGFTIVELVIVIAVIAILAAVLIPTFVSLTRKANESKDTQLVRNLNTALAADNTDRETMSDALAAAAAFGYDVGKINASATGNEILWDSKADVFCYFNDGVVEYIPENNPENKGTGADLWVISNTVSETYSTYLYGFEGDAVTAIHNLDAGTTEGLTVTYDKAGTATIRTNGGELIVNNESATVYHYGTADKVTVKAVASASYHLRAEVSTLEVWHGNIVPESGSVQVLLVTKGEGAKDDAKVTFNPIAGSTAVVNSVVIDKSAASVDDAAKEAFAGAVESGKLVEAENAEAIENAIAQATAFAAGTGTEADPYIIANAEQLQNINLYYEVGYKYYKVADGVETIDCANWPEVKLNGSFNGNGVKLINLDSALFRAVGTVTEDVNNVDNIVLENFEATMNVTNGNALVRNIYNGGETTFKNIKVHGYIESNMNTGVFYKYGTANGTDDGCSYTVNFINATSDATLVDTLNRPGTMIGHTFPGAGNTVTINMDEASGFTGAVYSTSGKAAELMAISNTCILNGEAYTNVQIDCNKIEVIKPVLTEEGVTAEKANGASSMVVTIGAQVTSYDAEGNKIANESGISMNLATIEIAEVVDGANKVLDKVTSLEIVNDYKDGTYGYELVDGVLKVYVGNRNALTGWALIQVSQYDANGQLLATGTDTSVRIDEVK